MPDDTECPPPPSWTPVPSIPQVFLWSSDESVQTFPGRVTYTKLFSVSEEAQAEMAECLKVLRHVQELQNADTEQGRSALADKWCDRIVSIDEFTVSSSSKLLRVVHVTIDTDVAPKKIYCQGNLTRIKCEQLMRDLVEFCAKLHSKNIVLKRVTKDTFARVSGLDGQIYLRVIGLFNAVLQEKGVDMTPSQWLNDRDTRPHHRAILPLDLPDRTLEQRQNYARMTTRYRDWRFTVPTRLPPPKSTNPLYQIKPTWFDLENNMLYEMVMLGAKLSLTRLLRPIEREGLCFDAHADPVDILGQPTIIARMEPTWREFVFVVCRPDIGCVQWSRLDDLLAPLADSMITPAPLPPLDFTYLTTAATTTTTSTSMTTTQDSTAGEQRPAKRMRKSVSFPHLLKDERTIFVL